MEGWVMEALIYFMSELKESKWQVPKNLGSSINNNLNQLSFIISADGSMAYFSQDFKTEQGKIKVKLCSYLLPVTRY